MTRSITIAFTLLLSLTAGAARAAGQIAIHEDISATPDGSGNLAETGGMFNLLFHDMVDDEDLVPDWLGVPSEELGDRDAAVAAGKPYALHDVVSFGHDAGGACQGDCLYAVGWRTATPVSTDAQPDLADAALMTAIKAYMLSAGIVDQKTASRLVVRTYSVESYLDIDPSRSAGQYARGGTVKCRCVFNYIVDPKTGKVYFEICNDCLLLVSAS
jgi:hypothetical protein